MDEPVRHQFGLRMAPGLPPPPPPPPPLPRRGAMRPLRIFDRVYGEVTLSALASRLVVTEEFFRLDAVRQLGGCAFVYPSATHTRREHSIGVSHLAAELGRHLRERHPELVDADDILCLEVAGLVHDLGHGPFSHTFERYMALHCEHWSHEDVACEMVDGLFREAVARGGNPFAAGSPDEHLAFVRLLVSGIDESAPWPGDVGRDERKRFLVEVVHNRISGVDVDKIDYLCRDSLATFGATRPLNVRRLLRAARVVEAGEGSAPRLGFDDSVAFELAELYALRARLHRQVYQHHGVVLVESLIIHLMTAIDAVSDVGGRFHERARDRAAFVSLTDASVLAHPRCTDPRVAPAREALFRWTAMTQVPTAVAMRTLPACRACGEEVEIAAAFCAACGASTADRSGAELADGTLVAPACLIGSDEATAELQARTGRADVCVHIVDVHCGSATTRVDPHGRPWREYDPLRGLRFVSRDGSVRWVDAATQQAPRVRHARTARCYLAGEDPADEAVRAVDAAFRDWAAAHGRAVQGWAAVSGT